MTADYYERLSDRRYLVDEVVGLACTANAECGRHADKTRKIAELAVDSWEPRFETMSEAEITRELRRSVKRKVKERHDEFGFVMVITMGMVLTWLCQALVVSIVAALVQRWFRDKESMRKVVQ